MVGCALQMQGTKARKRTEPYPFGFVPHLQAEAGRVERRGSRMQKIHTSRKGVREKERDERERERD